MNYKIIILKRARKFIEKQTPETQKRILQSIMNLPEGDVKSLRGHNGIFRLRVNNIRIIYSIDNETITITVIDAGSRGQIYNKY